MSARRYQSLARNLISSIVRVISRDMCFRLHCSCVQRSSAVVTPHEIGGYCSGNAIHVLEHVFLFERENHL